MSPTAVFPSFNDRPSLFALGATDGPGCLWLGHPAETQIEGADQRLPPPSSLGSTLLRSASLPHDDTLLCTSSRLKDLKRVKREWKFSETYGFCENSLQSAESVYVLMRRRDSLFLSVSTSHSSVLGRWRCPEPDLWDLALCHVQTSWLESRRLEEERQPPTFLQILRDEGSRGLPGSSAGEEKKKKNWARYLARFK